MSIHDLRNIVYVTVAPFLYAAQLREAYDRYGEESLKSGYISK